MESKDQPLSTPMKNSTNDSSKTSGDASTNDEMDDLLGHFQSSMSLTHNHDDDSSCPVCLSPFKKDSNIKMTKCKHIFHHLCLKQAKYRSTACPMCR